MADELLHDTREALGPKIIKEIHDMSFCIVGCGAVGSLFAEMLVRSGALDIYLIDEDDVERDNLNRTTAFIERDVGKPKVEVLKGRLESIISDDTSQNLLTVKPHKEFLRREDDESASLIRKSDFVIIAMNENRWRVLCEEICRRESIKYISIGVAIGKYGVASYECLWMPITDRRYINQVGYGDGSYASIVMEATAVGFGMLLSHLHNPERKLMRIDKDYKDFINVSSVAPVSNKNALYRLVNLLGRNLRLFHR